MAEDTQNVLEEVGALNTETENSVSPCKESEQDEQPAAEQSSVKVTAVPEDTTQSTSPSSLPGYLPWEEDMEMVSKYLDRKDELEDSHKEYLRRNPELKAILADFLQAVLIQKPSNIYDFAKEFFRPFGSNAAHQPPFPSYRSTETKSD